MGTDQDLLARPRGVDPGDLGQRVAGEWAITTVASPASALIVREPTAGESQIGFVYDYWDQHFIPRMEAHGYPINRVQQPSRETYFSTFFTSQRTRWLNNYLGALAPAEQGRLEPVCAPYPPDEAFFGSSQGVPGSSPQ